jgi:hypothetical protein
MATAISGSRHVRVVRGSFEGELPSGRQRVVMAADVLVQEVDMYTADGVTSTLIILATEGRL